MAEFPALPFWTDAYLADTIHLNTREHGAYLLLLITAWRTADCALPDDDKLLARYARMDKRGWRSMRPVLEQFFTVSQGKWVQKRLQKERKYVEELSRKNSENARARWLKNNTADNATAMPNECQTDAPTPTPTPIPEQKERTDAANPVSTTSSLSEKTIPTHTGGDAQNAPPDNVASLDAKRGYRWEGEVIKLNLRDYDAWKARFHAIPDFDAMLWQIDEHYAANPGKRKSWFHAASGWLQNEHQKRMEKQSRADIARQKQAQQQAREERWEAMERKGGEAAAQAKAERQQWMEDRMEFLRKRNAERENNLNA